MLIKSLLIRCLTLNKIEPKINSIKKLAALDFDVKWNIYKTSNQNLNLLSEEWIIIQLSGFVSIIITQREAELEPYYWKHIQTNYTTSFTRTIKTF